jgi:hypothetical protein
MHRPSCSVVSFNFTSWLSGEPQVYTELGRRMLSASPDKIEFFRGILKSKELFDKYISYERRNQHLVHFLDHLDDSIYVVCLQEITRDVFQEILEMTRFQYGHFRAFGNSTNVHNPGVAIVCKQNPEKKFDFSVPETKLSCVGVIMDEIAYLSCPTIKKKENLEFIVETFFRTTLSQPWYHVLMGVGDKCPEVSETMNAYGFKELHRKTFASGYFEKPPIVSELEVQKEMSNNVPIKLKF